jgi:DNA polymerase-3 subunit delta
LKLSSRQLRAHLGSALESTYLVAGQEPLLVAEATDAIRSAARERGFDQRDLYSVERGFKWSELESGADSLSLFAARRIIELRLPSGRPGDAGARTLSSLAERPDPDRLVLIVAGRLDGSAARSAWVKSIERHGVLVQAWPIERGELPGWLRARAGRLKLDLTAAAAELLAERVEGNLLAASQELQKLFMARGAGRIDEDAILEAVAVSARFDVFRLSDAVLAGDAGRALAVLRSLRAEGVEPTLVCWALSREIVLLGRLKFALGSGESLDRALGRHGVWRRRQPVVRRALKTLGAVELRALLALAAEADTIIKGRLTARPWDALTRLVMAMLRPGLLPRSGTFSSRSGQAQA